jgi:hypothetical protein
MRRADDMRDDTIVKKQMLDTYFPDTSKIEAVIDDRPPVIRMWRENGLNVIDVGKGIEFEDIGACSMNVVDFSEPVP